MGINKRTASLIMAILGSAGVVGGLVLTTKVTPDANEKIKADSRINHDGDPYGYTKLEAVKSAWKYYVAPAAIGVATISCIWGLRATANSNIMNLSSAYMLINEAHKRAVSKKISEYSDETTFDIPEDQTLFYDTMSDRYFDSTLLAVREAEYQTNREFALLGSVSLKTFYMYLNRPDLNDGLPDVGWSLFGGMEFGDYLWLEFGHELTTMDDGLKCCIISPGQLPDDEYNAY